MSGFVFFCKDFDSFITVRIAHLKRSEQIWIERKKFQTPIATNQLGTYLCLEQACQIYIRVISLLIFCRRVALRCVMATSRLEKFYRKIIFAYCLLPSVFSHMNVCPSFK